MLVLEQLARAGRAFPAGLMPQLRAIDADIPSHARPAKEPPLIVRYFNAIQGSDPQQLKRLRSEIESCIRKGKYRSPSAEDFGPLARRYMQTMEIGLQIFAQRAGSP